MGVPFWVRSGFASLIVKPQSGYEREIIREEFVRCLPPIEARAPRARWQHLTQNSSYLESIVDLLVEQRHVESVPATVDSASASPALPLAEEALDQALTTGLLRERVADLEAEVERLRIQLRGAKAELAPDGEVVRRAQQANAKVERLRELLSVESDRRRSAEQRLAALEAGRRADGNGKDLEAQLASALSDLREARKRRDDEIRLRQSAEAELAPLQDKVRSLQAQAEELKSLAAQSPSPEPYVPLSVVFDLGGMNHSALARIPPAVSNPLVTSAKKVATSPVDSVGDARRALEFSVEILAARHGGPRTPRVKMYEMLDALRGSPSLPSEDWHLIKNLWSRASAVVHGGEADARIALWIWLGVVQIAELTVDAGPSDNASRTP